MEQKIDRLQLLFAHQDERLPPDFVYPIAFPSGRSERIIRKWKSRRMAYFLLQTLFQQIGIEPERILQIQRTSSGRPYLKHSNLDFNISHSGEWVAIIFSLHCPKRIVSIDIEQPKKTRDYLKLLRYFASEQEQNELENSQILPTLDRLESRFYLSWCLREAVLKSQGIGIVKLSEVQHYVAEQQIYSAYCPKGTLHFSTQFPFYLAYFVAETDCMLSSLPTVKQWRQGQFEVQYLTSLQYQVN